MTSTEFIALCKECEQMLRDLAPNPATRYKPGGSTGNLMTHGVCMEMVDANTCRLYIDENEAPYMKYTNEPWTNGKKNPNEGWFDKAVKQIIEFIANKLGGELKS